MSGAPGVWNWWSITSLVLFFIVMLGLGASLKISEFLLKLKKPKGIMIGAALQFILMPFVCYMITHLFAIKGNLSVGVLLIGCCPGGALSNIVCYIFMEDITLSIAMTAFSSLLALAFVPLNLFLYLETFYTRIEALDYDIGGLALSIAVVVLGTLCGLYCSHYKNGIYSFTLERIARIAMLLLIIGSFVANSTSHTPLWQYEPLLYFVILLPTLIGTCSGIVFAKLFRLHSWSSCVAVGVEVGMQNQILAIAIITLTFEDIEIRNQILGIPLVYGTFSTLFNLFLCVILFHFGITDAPRGATLLGAWKAYHKQRNAEIMKQRQLLLYGDKHYKIGNYRGIDSSNDHSIQSEENTNSATHSIDSAVTSDANQQNF